MTSRKNTNNPRAMKRQRTVEGNGGKLSHYDDAGRATMVDVSGKAASRREAEASAFIEMSSGSAEGAAAKS